MKILVVGGNFDVNGGKPSKVIEAIHTELSASMWRNDTLLVNGGSLDKLKALVESDWLIKQYRVVLWAPNVSNDEEKLLHSIKKLNPKCVLVSTKQRRHYDEYTHGDIVGRLLKTRSNLGITFDIYKKPFKLTVSDPLGNEYYSGYDIKEATTALRKRLQNIDMMKRVSSSSIGEINKHPEIEPKFIETIQRFGKEFSKFVNAVNPNRLLGNASTRCAKGFPAVRSETGNFYYVSKRNVDKEGIASEDFVPVTTCETVVEYVGTHKPSVDTPIQVRIFNRYPNIKYMIHGHVYVKNGLETGTKIPCGYVDEFDEIMDLYPKANTNEMLINLRGHGCLICVDDLSKFDTVEFMGRPFPEGENMFLPAIPAIEVTPVLPKPPLVLEGSTLLGLGFR
jgi:ribulose-5-phosphate 4-epimerase/fuculose-1-phosphate aldolase